jgi:hypothetical protein
MPSLRERASFPSGRRWMNVHASPFLHLFASKKEHGGRVAVLGQVVPLTLPPLSLPFVKGPPAPAPREEDEGPLKDFLNDEVAAAVDDDCGWACEGVIALAGVLEGEREL